MAVKNYKQNKNTVTSGKLIKAVYAIVRLCLYFFVQVSQIGYSIIPYLFDWGEGMWGPVSEKFVSKAMGENGDGLDV
jgi:hypothetical protein